MADLLTPRDVTRLLERHGLAPRKADGQNFVVDPNTVRRIVAAADLDPTDTVLEFGPGLGSLTLGLADAAQRVIAVEIDAGFVGALTEVLAGVPNVEVHHADALRVDLHALIGATTADARLVANLPYNIATPLLFQALACAEVRDALVMVQREVGERWVAAPGDAAYGAVPLKLALAVEPRIALSIPRAVFLPVPNVDSVMVRVTRRPDAPDEPTVRGASRLADLAFGQRRKTLRNNLRALTTPALLAEAAAAADIDLSARAQTLDRDALLALYRALRERDVDV
ncbi:MAG: 16S rRNA (adenine(1518)-N(6)/adenine(1519)-N(6))-dimethyltransferase RsmA [Nitriliruptoraceae bacterium]|nr:16S rRNA (adenine(1518)-N(6)/adenine(1519)-N(6))-dimethyltransferase RsmA [Nitriliruptoraceae bacterium]